jgi:hypothetical protein
MKDETIDDELESEQALLEDSQPLAAPIRRDRGTGRMRRAWLLILPWLLCLVLAIALGITVTMSATERCTDGYWRSSEFSA